MARKKFGLTLETRNVADESATPSTVAKIKEINYPVEDPFGYKLVPYEKIRKNEKNDYEIGNLSSLKESILRGELLHNFDVKYEIESGSYVLISGERRFTALEILRDESSQFDSEKLELYKKNVDPYFSLGFPCKVVNRNKNLDEIDSLILLNEANLEVRDLSPAKKAAKIAELQELYKKRNERDGKTNSVQEQVADTLNISKRQVQQYTAINEKLIPELKEEFDNHNISVKEGSSFAQLDEEGQRSILNIIKKQGKVDNSDMIALKQENAIREKKIKELENELQEKNTQLSISEEKAATTIKKNNELIASLNKSKEDAAIKEEELRKKITEEIKLNNEETSNALQKELAKVQEDKKNLEQHIVDIECQNKAKESEVEKLRKELMEQKEKLSATPEPALKPDEKLLLKYNYELSQNVDEIRSLITKATRIIENAKKLNITLTDDFNINASFISKISEIE